MTTFLLILILYANLTVLKDVINAYAMFDFKITLYEPTFTFIMMGLLLFMTVFLIVFAGYSIYKCYIPSNIVGLQRQIRKLESKMYLSLTGALVGALLFIAFPAIGYSHLTVLENILPKNIIFLIETAFAISCITFFFGIPLFISMLLLTSHYSKQLKKLKNQAKQG